MMDLRRVHVLRVVDQLGTLTAAAELLHLTPSAVSQQLRLLARDLGVVLLEPDGRRVRLTAAAHALLRHADDLAARWERARAELADLGAWEGAELRMCGFPSSLDMVVAPAAALLRETEPALRVRISEVEAVAATERLLAGAADVAVVVPHLQGPTADDPRFELQPLLDDAQDLLVPPDHPLAGRADVALADAARESWVLADPGSCDQYDQTVAACTGAGFRPAVAHEAHEWAAVASLVAHGFGVSMMPGLVRLPAGLPVVRVPLRDAPRRRLLTCVRRGSGGQRPVAAGLDALARAAVRAQRVQAGETRCVPA